VQPAAPQDETYDEMTGPMSRHTFANGAVNFTPPSSARGAKPPPTGRPSNLSSTGAHTLVFLCVCKHVGVSLTCVILVFHNGSVTFAP
jgi:hypothetical protein